MTKNFEISADGHRFSIGLARDGGWVARQMTGTSANYLGQPAVLFADTLREIHAAVRRHTVN